MQQPSQPGGNGGGGQGGYGGASGGGGGNDIGAMLTEGWGGGEFDTDILMRNIKIAFKRAIGPVLYSWVIIAAATLMVDLVSSFFSIVAYYADDPAIASGVLGLQGIFALLSIPLSFLIGALQFSLYRPMRRELFEGAGAGGDLKSMLESASSVALPVLGTQLLVMLVAGIAGICFVFPGLFAAFILSMSVYLVATRGIGPIAGMKYSITLVKKYWQTVAVAFVGAIVVGVAGGCIVNIFGWIIGLASSVIRPFNSLVLPMVAWVISTAGVFGWFVIWTGVFATIDSYESGDYVKE
jgi:hypothetical protein